MFFDFFALRFDTKNTTGKQDNVTKHEAQETKETKQTNDRVVKTEETGKENSAGIRVLLTMFSMSEKRSTLNFHSLR